MTAQALGLSQRRNTPAIHVKGGTVAGAELGGPLRTRLQANQRRYIVPSIFMPVCSDGAASRRPASPPAVPADSDARPQAMPVISGIERLKPNWEPEAVANVVAPPGDIVVTKANNTSGAVELNGISCFSRMFEQSEHIRPLNMSKAKIHNVFH